MDCGVLIDPEGGAARCIPMALVKKGDKIVVGRQGLRVFPAEPTARQNLFEFMASPVSSEKPKGVTVREIAAAMKRTKAAKERILAVLGPAVVHTGSVEHICICICTYRRADLLRRLLGAIAKLHSNDTLTWSCVVVDNDAQGSARAVVDAIEHRVDVHTLDPVPGAGELALNDIGRVRLRISAPLVADTYARNRATGRYEVS